MPRRPALALLLVLTLGLLVTAPGGHSRTAGAQSAEAPGLAVVKATYDILLDQFYRPLEPAALLGAAWDGLATVANQQNLRPPSALPPLPAERGAAFERFGDAYAVYVNRLGRTVNTTSLAFIAAFAMTRSVNEGHTVFLTPQSYRAYLDALLGGQMTIGLGVRRTTRPPWAVTAVAPGGPAERAGIRPGDLLLAADGRDLTRLSNQQLAVALGGPDGSEVALTVSRSGEELVISVTRGPFYFPPLSARMLGDGVGYLRLENFVDAGIQLPNGTEFLSELDRRLDELDAQGARGLILDLRGNPGGSVLTTTEVLGRFLPEDELSVDRSDQRGHLSRGIVSGLMRRVQHPMVVLVDGGSGSSSEVAASTLREAGRVLLVGRRTAGVLATAQVLPVPEGAGVVVAVAEQVTSRSGFRIDEQGFPVDIEVDDTRLGEGEAAGRDEQLEAAVAALAQAPAPPAFRATASPLNRGELQALLARYLPSAAEIPASERMPRAVAAETLTLTHPNQLINVSANGARDPLAVQAAIRSRGWLGSFGRGFNAGPRTPPFLSVGADLYETEAGAAEAVAANDYPDVQVEIPTLATLGEQSVSYRGIWFAFGGVSTSWRRGRVVFSVSYSDVPGFERSDVLAEIARLVDRLAQENPLPEIAPRLPAFTRER